MASQVGATSVGSSVEGVQTPPQAPVDPKVTAAPEATKEQSSCLSSIWNRVVSLFESIYACVKCPFATVWNWMCGSSTETTAKVNSVVAAPVEDKASEANLGQGNKV